MLKSRFAAPCRLAALIWTGLLAGCGVSTTGSPSAPVPAASNLNGNWLLVGTLPFSSAVGPVTNNSFGVAATFDVIGNQVLVATSTNVSCGVFVSGGAGAVLTGTVAADGSFSATTPASTPSALATMQLSGVVPATGTSSWKGSLTYTNTGTSCAFAQTVGFSATPLANLTGTYSGATTLNFGPGTPTQPVTLSFVLQQGGTLPGTTSYDTQVLSGTVDVQGSSCFKSGTAAAVGTGNGVLGTAFVGQFTMNDGSTLNLIGNIQDANALKLAVTSVFSTGSTCGSGSTGPFALLKQ